MTPPAAWLPATDPRTLGPRDVHVWRLPLGQPPEQLAALAQTLAPDEHARAARFYFDRDRNTYTAVRGVLRTLAARYLDHAPGQLAFGYQAKGKPYLVTPRADLRFNVSHSGDYALLAFARGCEIGVDVERSRPMKDLSSLARISFSEHEYATWCRLAPHEQPEAFFACWSRKEAFIKTTGEGVSQLADFDVTLQPGEPARLLRVKGSAEGRLRWSMHELPAIPGHAAALVVEAHEVQLRCWDWPPAR